MRVVIIDYGLGNLASVANALQKLEIPFKISDDPIVIKNAKVLILPGVGAAGQGMENLKKRKLDIVIIEQAKKGILILGICLGMQLLMDWSEEGNVRCLGLIKGKVRKFNVDLKVPQIGWNQVVFHHSGQVRMTLLEAVENNVYFYFVNSYVCEPEDKSAISGVTDYGGNFCSVFEKDNIYGVQFHPEKSGEAGLKLLRQFISKTINI